MQAVGSRQGRELGWEQFRSVQDPGTSLQRLASADLSTPKALSKDRLPVRGEYNPILAGQVRPLIKCGVREATQ